jgi:hypothetical protein
MSENGNTVCTRQGAGTTLATCFPFGRQIGRKEVSSQKILNRGSACGIIDVIGQCKILRRKIPSVNLEGDPPMFGNKTGNIV